MKLIPTLELLGGDVVRLIGGSRGQATFLDPDPVDVAREMRRSGARLLHVVDLDALLDRGHNNRVLRRLADDCIPFQVRGGVRSMRRAKELFQLGAQRIVLGDLCFRDWSEARNLVRHFGKSVVATLDVQDGNALIEGAEHATMDLDRALTNVVDSGVEHVVFNSVSNDGDDTGVDHAVLQSVMSHGRLQVHARCTVRSTGELDSLLELEGHGLRSLIINQPIDEEALQLHTALTQCIDTHAGV